jgi:hypothetical protein
VTLPTDPVDGVADHGGDLDTRALLALVARHLDLRLPEIVSEMRDLLASRIDDLGGDPQLVEMLHGSIEGNVTTICHILTNDIDVDSLQPTTAAVEYAARLAQRDVPLSSLTRAYYLGQSMFLRLGIAEVERLDIPEGMKIEVIRGIADAVHRYIDWILQFVSTVHDEERRRWWNTRATLNATVVLKVLRGDALPVRGFASETGYSLGQEHLAVVAWSDVDVNDPERQREIDHALRRIGGALRSPSPPLVTAVDRSTAWAWIGSPILTAESLTDTTSLVRTVPGLRLALGTIARDVAGFRRSHEQAVAARLVALTSPRYRPSTVVSYTDPQVALVDLLTKDAASTRRWVVDVLGPYAAPGEQTRLVRETLAVYFACGENAVRAAELLGIHRNTVRQRVDRFRNDRDSHSPDGLQIALALRVYDDLPPEAGEPSTL